MNHLLRIASATVAIAVASMVGAVSAHAEPVEADRAGSLTIHKHVQDEQHSTPGSPAGQPLAGIEFTLAEVAHGGEPLDLATAEGWTLAETVIEGDAPALPVGFALGRSAIAITGTDGAVTFADLPLGLYLVTETGFGDNDVVEPAAPFWVSVPMPGADGSWTYDVVAYPKNTLATPTPIPTPAPTPIPTPTPTPAPKPGPPGGSIDTGIPGVGEVNLVLLLGGAGLVAGAFALLIRSRKRGQAAGATDGDA